jgi:hypothetical protein
MLTPEVHGVAIYRGLTHARQIKSTETGNTSIQARALLDRLAWQDPQQELWGKHLGFNSRSTFHVAHVDSRCNNLSTIKQAQLEQKCAVRGDSIFNQGWRK